MILALIGELNILSDEISKTQKFQKKKDIKEKLLVSDKEKANYFENEIVKLHGKSEGINAALLHDRESLKKLNHENHELETFLQTELSIFNLNIPITDDTDKFIIQLENKISSFHNKNKEFVEVENSISQLSSEIRNREINIKEKTGSKGILEEENRKTDEMLTQLSENRNSILPLKISTDKKREELQNDINVSKDKLEKYSQNLAKLKTQKATKEKEKENIENEGREQQDELKIKNLAFSKNVQNSIFESRFDIEKALLEPDDELKFSGIRKGLENKTIELNTLDIKLKDEIIGHEKEKDFELAFDEALDKHRETESAKKQLLERVGEIRTQFELDNQIKERNKNVIEEISTQEKVLKIWTDLLNLLGGSMHSFNTYVQRLTLQSLIQFANIHLYKLNRRYSLKMNETYKTGEELNFMLIDYYQASEARLVDTSSGGEKFLISLALALGLSDLASNNVSVESLFIDEGFGTLDNNTLE
ncbi:MAG: SbcC/MukB-like Walker B domain-containing protein, partial [Bacteroidota bacterium]|nr:SbcC/MukB-like Walker B domain-containing protein [Bacteroidota bacterium]